MNDQKNQHPQDTALQDEITGDRLEDLTQAAAAAEAQEAAARKEPEAGVYTHLLSRPLQWEGKTYDALTFQWSALTGADHLEIENELLMRGKTLVVPEYTGDYLLGMAVRACTERNEKGLRALDYAALKALSLNDFMAICKKARYFLLRRGS